MHGPAKSACIALAVVAATATTAVSASARTASATGASGPPSAMFKKGYNLCKAASLASIKKAGGQPYRAGIFDGRVCNWERKGLKAGITVSITTGPQVIGMKQQLSTVHGSKVVHGIKIKRVSVPGASLAAIETLPAIHGLPSLKGEVHKDLFAVYSAGMVHVSMTAPHSLPDSRLFAVLKAVTRS